MFFIFHFIHFLRRTDSDIAWTLNGQTGDNSKWKSSKILSAIPTNPKRMPQVTYRSIGKVLTKGCNVGLRGNECWLERSIIGDPKIFQNSWVGWLDVRFWIYLGIQPTLVAGWFFLLLILSVIFSLMMVTTPPFFSSLFFVLVFSFVLFFVFLFVF